MANDPEYQVLARKWRPKQFSEVVGQAHVTRTLGNAIRSGRVAHAYLFVGPRGIGKTSIARIFAKALNCETGPTETPCDRCDSCREIAAGSALDVIEIDGASNNSVDQVRDLREKARFTPARSKFKIYIIDEVHMLSAGAFNALLKTLEEPPEHVKFFFATTEAHRVPATIVSRCQRFDLRRISARDILAHLARIAEAEGVRVSEDALLAIARGAEGAMRDAESALDQLISFRGREIGEEDVLSVFGLVSRRHLETMSDAILRGDFAALLRSVAELDAAGKNLGRIPLELIEHFRNVLIAMTTGDAAAADTAAGQAEVLRRQAGQIDEARLLRVLDILVESESRVRQSMSPRTHLEMCLVRCARAATSVSLEAVLRRLNECLAALGEGGETARPTGPAPSAVSPMAEPDRPRPPDPSRVSEPAEQPAEEKRRDWSDVVERIRLVNPYLAERLEGSELEEAGGDRVVIHLRGARHRPPHKPIDEEDRHLIEKALWRAWLRRVTVEFGEELPDALAPDPPLAPSASEPAAEQPPDAPASAVPPDVLRPPDDARERQGRMINSPVVQTILKKFDGSVTGIE